MFTIVANIREEVSKCIEDSEIREIPSAENQSRNSITKIEEIHCTRLTSSRTLTQTHFHIIYCLISVYGN